MPKPIQPQKSEPSKTHRFFAVPNAFLDCTESLDRFGIADDMQPVFVNGRVITRKAAIEIQTLSSLSSTTHLPAVPVLSDILRHEKTLTAFLQEYGDEARIQTLMDEANRLKAEKEELTKQRSSTSKNTSDDNLELIKTQSRLDEELKAVRVSNNKLTHMTQMYESARQRNTTLHNEIESLKSRLENAPEKAVSSNELVARSASDEELDHPVQQSEGRLSNFKSEQNNRKRSNTEEDSVDPKRIKPRNGFFNRQSEPLLEDVTEAEVSRLRADAEQIRIESAAEQAKLLRLTAESEQLKLILAAEQAKLNQIRLEISEASAVSQQSSTATTSPANVANLDAEKLKSYRDALGVMNDRYKKLTTFYELSKAENAAFKMTIKDLQAKIQELKNRDQTHTASTSLTRK